MAATHPDTSVVFRTPRGEIFATRVDGVVHDSKFIDPTTGKVVALGEQGDFALAQALAATEICREALGEANKIHSYLAAMPDSVKALAATDSENPVIAPYRRELDVVLKTAADMQCSQASFTAALERLANQRLSATEPAGHGLPTNAYVSLPAGITRG